MALNLIRMKLFLIKTFSVSFIQSNTEYDTRNIIYIHYYYHISYEWILVGCTMWGNLMHQSYLKIVPLVNYVHPTITYQITSLNNGNYLFIYITENYLIKMNKNNLITDSRKIYNFAKIILIKI